jgi:hypothetical protein
LQPTHSPHKFIAESCGDPLEFSNSNLIADVARLCGSSDAHENAVGQNWDLEELVSDTRRNQFEACAPALATLSATSTAHFQKFVQGTARAHLPTTFDEASNTAAMLPATIEDTQKIVRLEKIDLLIDKDDSFSFERLSEAAANRELDVLSEFANLFQSFPGARPAFAAFKAEVEDVLKDPDWLQLLVHRLGLLQHLPSSGETFHFALMEYTVGEVRIQAEENGVTRPFARATMLESRCSPAFFPVPKGAAFGFTVDLGAAGKGLLGPQEFLHARFDYAAKHVIKLSKLVGPAPVPDLSACRLRHVNHLRSTTGRTTYGNKHWPLPTS